MFRRLGVQLTCTTALLVAVTTALTFFVMTTFWLRHCALMTATSLELYANAHLQHATDPAREAASLQQSFSRAFPQTIEALCLSSGLAQYDCSGEPQARLALIAAMKQAQQSGLAVRNLGGLLWLHGIPAARYLDLAPVLAGKPEQGLALRITLSASYRDILQQQRYIGLYLAVNLLLIVVVGYFRFRRSVIKPVEGLIHMTDSYTDAGGVPFFNDGQGSELGQLGSSLARMLERIHQDQRTLQQHVQHLEQANAQLLANREEMIRAEKLSSVGRLAAGLAHEIGNPIAIVQGYLGLIRQGGQEPAEVQEFCTRAEQELQRISQLVRGLLDFSRPTLEETTTLDVHELIRQTVELLQPHPLVKEVEIQLVLQAQQCRCKAVAAQLIQVLLNCLLNAADAIHAVQEQGAGQIVLKTANDPALTTLRICCRDNGSGVDPVVLANVFDPFFTTKAPGQGTGLGLSVSYSIVLALGGDIRLGNLAEGGAEVRIELPLAAAE